MFGTFYEKNKHAWNWVGSKFNASRFAVDPWSGVLIDKTAQGVFAPGSGLSGAMVSFNPSTFSLDPGVVSDLGLVQCGVSGTPASCMTGHLFNPAPRVGFAWDPKGDGKTSIRGGYGIFFEHGTGNESNTGSLEASAPLVLSMTQPLPLSYPCIGNVGYGPAFNPAYNPCANPQFNTPPPPAGSAFPLNVTAIPTKAVWPYAQQWSFGIQRQIPGKILTTIAYVGETGGIPDVGTQSQPTARIAFEREPLWSERAPNFGRLHRYSDRFFGRGTGVPAPGNGSVPFLLQSGTLVTPQSPAYVYLQAACANPNIPNVNSLPHPYQGLGQVLSLENVAVSTYHALQATMRRTSGPLTLGVSYSYSHSI